MHDILKLGPYGMAAYALAWIIYLGYLGQILLRIKKVTAEREELERNLTAPSRREMMATESQRS